MEMKFVSCEKLVEVVKSCSQDSDYPSISGGLDVWRPEEYSSGGSGDILAWHTTKNRQLGSAREERSLSTTTQFFRTSLSSSSKLSISNSLCWRRYLSFCYGRADERW
jgi:hypothetical protein